MKNIKGLIDFLNEKNLCIGGWTLFTRNTVYDNSDIDPAKYQEEISWLLKHHGDKELHLWVIHADDPDNVEEIIITKNEFKYIPND